MRKQYLKFYPSDWLEDGICSVLSPAQRGVYLQLWALAGISREEGTIHIRPGQPFDLHHLARRLRIKQELLKDTLTRCSQFGMLSEDENGIHITGWKLDQAPPITPKPPHHRSGTTTDTTAEDPKHIRKERELYPSQLEKQSEQDAKEIYAAILKHDRSEAIIRESIGPERSQHAADWTKEHANEL